MKISSTPQLPDTMQLGKRKQDQDRDLASKFESLLVHELVKSMRATVQRDDEEFGLTLSTDMMDQAMSDAISGRLGLGEKLLGQLNANAQAPVALDTELPARAATGPALPSLADTPNLDLPVDGVITSGFGERRDPIHGQTRTHHGLDIAAPQGQEIYAVRSGTVTYAARRGGYGKTVEIRHADGSVTRYAHASKIHVRLGDKVHAGECVADVGSTGRSTGPHLHFEVRRAGRPVDPMKYLKSQKP